MTMAPNKTPTRVKQRSLLDRWYFTGMAIVMIAISVAGFLPAIAHPATRRAPLLLLAAARANALESRTLQGADADAARVRAFAAYRNFLTLWKDADPDTPILIAAKSEYTKLH
jgi:hypothetical protein